MQDIYFYSRGTNYGWLSNFERAKQTIDCMDFPTNEHYYQSRKAKSMENRIWIAKAPSPFLAMKAGRALREKEMVDDWNTKKVEIMRRGLLAKFGQNTDLKQKLLDTGNARLHEDSPSDMFWGVKGKDILGKLLMEVRDKLREFDNFKCDRDFDLFGY